MKTTTTNMKILTNSQYENLKNRIKELEKKIYNFEEDQKIILARKDAEVETKVYEATKDLKEKLSEITMENNSNKKEVEILTKAFENLGFDVKDMKDILNKLVDGIVGKNTVHVVK